MEPIRLIAMDMDGTLLTRTDPLTACIPPENEEMLRRCADAGIHLAFASGRMPDDAGFFALDTGLPAHIIGLNGSVILEHAAGEPVEARFLPPSIARGVLDILTTRGIEAAVFGAWEVTAMQEKPLSWAQLALGSGFGREGGRLAYHSGGLHAERLLECAGKIVAFGGDRIEELAQAKAQINAEFPELSISSSWWDNFEVNAAGVDKGSALAMLADRLKIPMSQVMAIGDNGNDVPMLRAAGIGVAMGNATADALAAADYVTLPHDAFGVAAAIRTLVFGEAVSGVRPAH